MAIPNNPSMATTTSQGAAGYAVGDPSMEVALATKMQLVLDQPMSDISTKLVNKDFEGDFFKIGDTVSIVKPVPESINVEIGVLNEGTILASNKAGQVGQVGAAKDNRLEVSDATFTKTVLTIDKYAKYAFILSDITKAEGKWNYESGNLDLAAQQMRKMHNVLTAQTIVTDTAIRQQQVTEGLNLGTPEAPIQLANADELYEKILVPMHSALYDRGAITADGQITYGSNPQEGKATKGAMFLPAKAYNLFLTSKYFTDRSTTAADEKVATANVAKVLGLEVNVEPALDPKAKRHVVVDSIAEGALIIVAGTSNCVTRANKVLTPDSFRSHTRFGTEFHGLEIFGEKVFTPEAAVVAYVKLPA